MDTRITMRIDHADTGHTHFAFFMSGGKCGDLVTTTDEATTLIDIFRGAIGKGFAIDTERAPDFFFLNEATRRILAQGA